MDIFRDVISLIINQCDSRRPKEPPADTKCPPAAQLKQAKRDYLHYCENISYNMTEKIVLGIAKMKKADQVLTSQLLLSSKRTRKLRQSVLLKHHPVGFPESFCGISCVFLWDFLCASVGFPVCFCGISCGLLWDFLCVSVGFPVCFCGILWEFPQKSCGNGN